MKEPVARRGSWIWAAFYLAVLAAGTAVYCIVSFSHDSQTPTLEGFATAIDGNTIELDGYRITIRDVDAPKIGQVCTLRSPGRPAETIPADCGQLAKEVLEALIAGQPVVCNPQYYLRGSAHAPIEGLVGDCRTQRYDIALRMVESGWARARPTARPILRREEALAEIRSEGLFAYDVASPRLDDDNLKDDEKRMGAAMDAGIPFGREAIMRFPEFGYQTFLNIGYFWATIGLFLLALVGYRFAHIQVKIGQAQQRVQTLLSYYEIWNSSDQQAGRSVARGLYLDAYSARFETTGSDATKSGEGGTFDPEDPNVIRSLSEECAGLIDRLQSERPKRYAQLFNVLTFLENVGYFIDQGMLPESDMIEIYGGGIVNLEQIFAAWIVQVRKERNDELIYEHFEKLCTVLHRTMKEKHIQSPYPEKVYPGWGLWKD